MFVYVRSLGFLESSYVGTVLSTSYQVLFDQKSADS